MVAETGLDRPDALTRLRTEGRLFELGDHLPTTEEAEIATLGFAPRIVGELGGQGGEVLTGSESPEDLLHLGVGLLGRPVGIDLQQDMTGSYLLVARELLRVFVVVGGHLGVANLQGRAQSFRIDHQIVDDPLFRHLEIALVLSEELGDLFVGQHNLVAQPVAGQAKIADLSGIGALLVIIDHLCVRHEKVLEQYGADLLGQ